MKLSTRARYGLRICFLLGLGEEGELMPLSKLVRRSGLSEKYSEQLLSMLRRADIVKAERGTNGGYTLARPAKDINLRELLEALDDGFTVSDCAEGGCEDMYCPNRSILTRLYTGVNAMLEQMTLKDMLDGNTCMPNAREQNRDLCDTNLRFEEND